MAEQAVGSGQRISPRLRAPAFRPKGCTQAIRLRNEVKGMDPEPIIIILPPVA